MGILIFIIICFVYYLFFRKGRETFLEQYPKIMDELKNQNQKQGEGENEQK